MKHFGNPLLSLAAPFLIMLALFGLLLREGRERVQVIPAISVGGGLIIASLIRRNQRRKMLLFEIRTCQEEEI